MAAFIGWIVRAVIFGTIVMYGAMGEILTEKAGHLNLGTPGIMCIGGSVLPGHMRMRMRWQIRMPCCAY